MAAPKGNKFATGGTRVGAGRKPLKVRELCAKAFIDRIPILMKIVDADNARAVDVVAAMNLLGKTGIPAQFENVGEMPTAVVWQLPKLPGDE